MFRCCITAHRFHAYTASQPASHRVDDAKGCTTLIKVEIIIDVLVLFEVRLKTRFDVIVYIVHHAADLVCFDCAIVEHTHQRFEFVDVVSMFLEVHA